MQANIIRAIQYFADFLNILILIRVLISWLRLSDQNPLVRLVYGLTEPILGPIRAMLQKSPLGGPGMMLDFSPIIAYFLVILVQNLLCSFIAGL